jgi:polysaccharide export outer membrane protein
MLVGACATPTYQGAPVAEAPISGSAAAQAEVVDDGLAPTYLIGPYDQLQVFVWRAEELSAEVRVRPDGRISTPLVEDMQAAGKTPTELARDIETALAEYVKTPEVTIIVDGGIGRTNEQVRIIGEVLQPAGVPYQAGMTVLDVMLSVGGLTEFASGNRTKLIRNQGQPNEEIYRVRLNDLMRRGDVTANVKMQPGDVLIVPESRF